MIVAIVGNAAEHGGAVVIARAGKMELASEIAISSSAQVALLVTPAVMLLSLFFAHQLPLTFRWEEALNFEGNSSPFVQYAHARACSILAKSNGSGRADHRLLVHAQEQRLLRRIAKFPLGLRDAALGRRVHSVAGEASEFAAQFNQFYRDCPVLTAEPESLRDARIDLVSAARIVLQNALECLGLKAPKEM